MKRAVRSRLLAAAAMGDVLCLVLGAAAPATQPGAEPATEPASALTLSPDDSALLHQLESGTWQQRKTAEEKIAQWDVTQIPVVRAMLAHTTSPEAQARLHAALARLQKRTGSDTSLITLHEKNAPAKKVYAELFRQAFAPLKTDPANLLDSLPPITVDANRQPFWSVLQQLQKTTGLGLVHDAAGSYALRRNAPIVPGPQVISGPFLIVATGTQLFALQPNGPGDKAFLLHLQIYSEPKALLFQVLRPMKLDKAVDDHGNSLELDPAMFGPDYDLPGQQLIAIGLQYPPANRGRRLVSVRGTITAIISLHSVGFDIADPVGAAAQSIDLGGVTLKFTGCKKAATGYQVNFATGPDPRNLLALATSHGLMMHLLGAENHELTLGNVQESVNPPTGNTFTYTCIPAPARDNRDNGPKRLLWNLPTDFRQVDIPFDFENVSIPIGNGKR